jgi:hypothetical protein
MKLAWTTNVHVRPSTVQFIIRDFILLILGKVKDGKCILPDGQVLTKSVRKEYRQLTRDEREAYVKMMNEMQRDGTYRMIGTIHQAVIFISIRR